MDLVTRLKLVNNEFNSGIDSSKKKVEELQETADDASKSIQDLGNRGSRSAKELLAEMAKTEQANRSTSNYNRQLKELQKTIADLTINYRAMSDEMKNSSLGQEVAAKIQELTAKASEYKDAIEDANASVRALASDTSGWDGMKQGIDAVSGALQGFAALGVLGADSTEKLVKVIAQLKAVEAATNAVIKVGNALQRQSALMTSISVIQSKALAKAKTLEAASTGKATIAQKAFNIVAKANPYVLLATAIITVVGALAAFALGTEKAKKKEEEAKEAHEKYMDSMEDSISKMSTAAYSFDSLAKKYRECRTEGEKQQFLNDYNSKLNDLGIHVNDINGLENVFVNNTENFRRACILRAQAMGLESMQAENYKEVMGDVMAARDLATGKGGQRINEGDPLFDLLKKYNVGQYVSRWGKDYISAPADVEKQLEKAIRAAGEKASKTIEEEQKNLQDQVDELNLGNAFNFNSTNNNNNNNNNNNKGINPAVGSLQAAQNEVNRLQTLLNNMSPDNPKFETTKVLLSDAKKEVERLKELLKESEPPKKLELVPNSLEEAIHFVQFFSKELEQLDPNTDEFQETLDLLNAWKAKQKEINDIINKTNVDYVNGSLAEANAKVAELQEQLKNLNPDTDKFQKVLTLLNQWKQKQDDINEAINGTVDKEKTVVDKYKDIVSQANDISLYVEIGEIDPSEGRRRIAELNKKLSKMGLSVKVELEFDTKIEKFQEAMESITDQISAPISAINNVKSAYQSMMDSFEDPEKDGWDQFFATFQFGTSVIEALNTVLTVLNTIQELVATSKAKSAAASIVDANAATADATAQSADATATMTNAGAHGAAGAAKAGESVASIPYVGPVLAIAAIAAVMAAIIGVIASAKSFATGGIVDAPSKYGDKNIIRVNGGEMILNNRQQANLFKLLDEGRKDTSYNLGGDVEFKIQGTQLVGVLNNINRKNSKI